MSCVTWVSVFTKLMAIAVFTTATSASVQLALTVQDNFPQRYSSIDLTCSCNGHCHLGQQTLVWTKNGMGVAEWTETTGSETPAKYELSYMSLGTEGFFAYMKIRMMDTEDNGEYRCQIQRDGTVRGTSNSQDLMVEQPPSREYPECSVRPVRDGRALICDSEKGRPPVSLQWFKDGQPLEQSTPTDDLGDFVQARLLVAEDDESSRGKFECSLTFRGEVTGSCSLDRPNTTIPTITSGLSTGQDLVVVCVTSGNPPVSSVAWDFTPSLHSSFREDGHVLMISNISSSDNGTRIICEGHNALGSNQASRVITLRPLEATAQPIAVQLEQTKVPTSVGELAEFTCTTRPTRSPLPPCVWHYYGHYVDPFNTSDRFLVEDRSEHVLSVLLVSTADVGALVTCRIMVSFQPNAETTVRADFPLTTEGMTVPMILTPPAPFTPKLDDSSNSWNFDIRSRFGYIIGGLMCLVLIGICCWVSLKAKSLLCGKRGTQIDKDNGTAKASCIRLEDNNFMVDLDTPSAVIMNNAPTVPPSRLTKQALLEQETPYQDLEDVSRQRQENSYQRLISNVWLPPPVSSYT